MLASKENWEKIVSEMGLNNDDNIVVYDNSDVISSCRCWFNFIYFGHNPKLVHVLNGGLKKWIKENNEVTKNIKIIDIVLVDLFIFLNISESSFVLLNE